MFVKRPPDLCQQLCDGSGASIEAIRSYFTDEQVVRGISGNVGIEYDDLINGDYKLMIEPIKHDRRRRQKADRFGEKH